MGWFSNGPEDWFKEIPKAVNRWWDSIPNTTPKYGHGLVKIITLGPVTFILSPSPEIMRAEFLARRGKPLSIKAAGITEPIGSGEYEVYAIYKRTRAGNDITNPLAIGNEVGHIFQLMAGMADPDGVEKAEFYV